MRWRIANMMWRRYGKSSKSILNLPQKQSWRQLRATKELSRNSERGTINHLGDREPSIIFMNSPETQEIKGRWPSRQAEVVKPRQRRREKKPKLEWEQEKDLKKVWREYHLPGSQAQGCGTRSL